MSNSFDFTIAVSPRKFVTLDSEIKYIKSALLYADSIKLISPVAHLYFELSSGSHNQTEKQFIRLLEKMLPLIKMIDINLHNQLFSEEISQAKEIFYSKSYKSISMASKFQMRNKFSKFSKDIDEKLQDILGHNNCNDISWLVKNNRIKLETFDSSFNDIDQYVMEYFEKLKTSVSNSYPLFDELSNTIMKSAIREGIINLTDVDRFKAGYAGLTDKLILKLPSFDFAELDEILSVRKELDKSLLRFRAKTINYVESIQTLPWDKDFEEECNILYSSEIVPSILEIEEMIEDNNILKNLGVNVLSDHSLLGNLSGLVIGIATAGAISSFSNAVAENEAMLAVGGTWALSKIACTYNDYKSKEKEIERKDLYFYYKAGKFLSDIQHNKPIM